MNGLLLTGISPYGRVPRGPVYMPPPVYRLVHTPSMLCHNRTDGSGSLKVD